MCGLERSARHGHHLGHGDSDFERRLDGDLLLGSVGVAATRALVKRIFEAPPEEPRVDRTVSGEVAGEGECSCHDRRQAELS
jgi:hypothetical protein